MGHAFFKLFLAGIYAGELHCGSGASDALCTQWEEETLKDLDSEGRAVITQHTMKVPY